jgi:hypothetical protein
MLFQIFQVLPFVVSNVKHLKLVLFFFLLLKICSHYLSIPLLLTDNSYGYVVLWVENVEQSMTN